MEHTIFDLIKKRDEIAGRNKVACKAADVLTPENSAKMHTGIRKRADGKSDSVKIVPTG